MDKKVNKVVFDSILGGQGDFSEFQGKGQYRSSLGIDPFMPILDSLSNISDRPSGLLRPAPSTQNSGTSINDTVMWIESNPKTQDVFVYDHQGSLYTVQADSINTFTSLSDGGSLSNSIGNGAAYYDNYIYLSKNTTIARYGPLDGTPSFNGDYWGTTLGKTALTQSTEYPLHAFLGIYYPFHVLHRHSDGRLYIADTIGGRGSISYISTSKTTVEGDTDNGSTYNILTLPQNFLPTAMASYGSQLAIAVFEGPSTTIGNSQSKKKAKILLWDTSSQNYNTITNDEFPDQFISSIRNVNGVLYVISADLGSSGFRISRYIGGYSFQEVKKVYSGEAPFHGGTSGIGDNLYIASYTTSPINASSVYAYVPGTNSLHNILNIKTGASYSASALCTDLSKNMRRRTVLASYSTGSPGGTNNGLVHNYNSSADYSTNNQYWWSPVVTVGQPFKIRKLRLSIPNILTANMSIIPSFWCDGHAQSVIMPTINSTNYGTRAQTFVLRPVHTSGTASQTNDYSFWLELKWTGSENCPIALPIEVEYELLDIDSAFV